MTTNNKWEGIGEELNIIEELDLTHINARDFIKKIVEGAYNRGKEETLEKVKGIMEHKFHASLAVEKDSAYNTGFEDCLSELLQELNNI